MARSKAVIVLDEEVKQPGGEAGRLMEEVAAVAGCIVALFAALSLASHQWGAGTAFAGRVGEGLARLLVPALGFAAYLLPGYLMAYSLRSLRGPRPELSPVRAAAGAALLASLAVVLSLLLREPWPVSLSGGWLGGFAAALLLQAFGASGASLLAGAALFLSFLFLTQRTVQSALGWGGRLLRRGVSQAREIVPAAAALPLVRKVPPNVRRDKEEEPPAPAERETAAAGEGPVIVVPDEPDRRAAAPKRRRAVQEELPFCAEGHYTPPPLSFLDAAQVPTVRFDEEVLRKSSQILETKLADFGIQGRVVEVRPGPVITTFDIEPAPGVKVNRIVSLSDDLSMALRVPGVRILAPVPGKAVVGIEVANPRREEVKLRDLLESEPFAQSPSQLTLALGKDTAGGPVVGDLARMPHLLIAGATGSGKSVAVNAMIMSILYKSTPRDVRFVMIDLKMLELSVYEDIPHLLVPVVTEPKKAVVVLKNIVEVMDDRYRLMKQRAVRGIDGYNKLIEREEGERQAGVIDLEEVAEDGAGAPGEKVERPPPAERLPKIVVIVDELADLMMTMGRQVEEPITRLAQKARAAGIHLILATQRPSVDVITGLIKANFPARMSFQTTARVDSRTILDHIGAERLLGGGDMLYMPPGTARLQRLQGPLVTENEIRKVVDFIKKQGSPQYAFGLLENPEEDDEEGALEDELSDELYDQAVQLVTESRQASISWVQRRLRVGYNRAARMIERMEREGVISASDNGRPREVLAQRIDAG